MLTVGVCEVAGGTSECASGQQLPGLTASREGEDCDTAHHKSGCPGAGAERQGAGYLLLSRESPLRMGIEYAVR